MVPKGWMFEVLDKLVEAKRNGFCIGPFGSDLMLKDYRSQGTPIVFVRDIKRGRFEWVSNVYVDQDKAKRLKAHSVQYPDIVITKMGLPPGIAAVYPHDSPSGIVTADIIKMSPNPILLDSYFGCSVLNSYVVSKQVAERTAGQTRPKLTLSDYKTIKILVPPLSEQRKIAQILSTWDKAIATTERLLANKQQQKKALMQRLLTGKQRFAGFEGEWMTVSVSDVCSIGRGRVISKEDMYAHEGPYPVYSSQTLNNGVMGSIDTYDFDGEFVTWTTDGVNAGTVFHRQGKFNCTNVCGTLKPIVEGLDCRFLSIALSRVAYKYVSHTLANPKLMNGVMGTVQFQMPSLGEQQKIADVIFKSGYEIEVTQKQLDNLKQQKKALMQQLLTGKRRVKVDCPDSATLV